MQSEWSSKQFLIKMRQGFSWKKYCNSPHKWTSHVGQYKIWACVSNSAHRCNPLQKRITFGLSRRLFNLVSKRNEKYPDSWRDLFVMYLVGIYDFFESWLIHEYTEMDDIYECSIVFLLVIFIIFILDIISINSIQYIWSY